MDSREIIRRNIAPLQFEAGAAGEDKKPRDLKKSFSLPELSMNLTYIIRWLGRVRKYSGLGKVLEIYGYFQICAGKREIMKNSVSFICLTPSLRRRVEGGTAQYQILL